LCRRGKNIVGESNLASLTKGRIYQTSENDEQNYTGMSFIFNTSKGKRWMEYTARVKKIRNIYKILTRRPEERRIFGRSLLDGTI
jgi:hypothetical protein